MENICCKSYKATNLERKNASCLGNMKSSFLLKNALKKDGNINPERLRSVVLMENYLLQKRFYSYIIICGRHICFLRALWFKTVILDETLISWWLSRVWTLFPRFFLIQPPELFQWLVQSSNCRGEWSSRERKRHAGAERTKFWSQIYNYLFLLVFSLSNSINVNWPQTPWTQGGS